MARYGMAIDLKRCFGCQACAAACKIANNLPKGVAYNRVLTQGGDFPDTPAGEFPNCSLSFLPMQCQHCDNPACVAVCPTGATQKRDDGIVIIDPEKAKGQMQIVDACPIGAIYWNEELQLPQKCTMCAELLDDPEYLAYLGDPKLKQPRCVEACPNRALIFGDLDDPNSDISKKIAAGKVTQLEGLEGVETNVVHLNIPTVFLAGTVYLPDEDEVATGAKVTLTCKDCGSVLTMETNYFGDWEFEDLKKDATYEIKIELDGYKPVTYTAKADTDHYVAETVLEKA